MLYVHKAIKIYCILTHFCILLEFKANKSLCGRSRKIKADKLEIHEIKITNMRINTRGCSIERTLLILKGKWQDVGQLMEVQTDGFVWKICHVVTLVMFQRKTGDRSSSDMVDTVVFGIT